ncbi:MAG: acuS4 [Actinoallomurus sp.]|jgi:oxidase EvaA|nr:acuS4 [Actinoallomurus sp.]
MTDAPAVPSLLLTRSDRHIGARVADSALRSYGSAAAVDEFRHWMDAERTRTSANAERIPLDDLVGWRSDPDTGAIAHESGRFFAVEGLSVEIPGSAVPYWEQPIMNQPEIGILGILAREFDGVLYFLMQAKAEPGNCNGVQISPTVQATRSNYTGVHRGRPVPYLEYFTDTSAHRVIADVRQSEQGSAFLRKRNRNMVIEVREDVELLDGFRWLTAGQLHELLRVDDLVNMDARSVLACLPFTGPGRDRAGRDGFTAALVRSCGGGEGGLHPMESLLSWITATRSGTEVRTRTVPLAGLSHWRRGPDRISHDGGGFFDVIGVKVEASGREVGGWTQPMFAARRPGIVAFLVTRVEGVLHVLTQLRVEPGFVDVAELAPTVQCTPENHERLPAGARPPFLDEVLRAAADAIRFDVTLSDEGGRFYHTRNRHLIVETAERHEHPDFRWMTLHQLAGLLRHSHYVDMQARSLLACLHTLRTEPGR